MATIKPFKAVRPVPGFEKDVAALPYDVYSRKEAKEFVKDRPLSFLNIDRAETHFDDSVDTYDSCVYEKAKELYREMFDKVIFFKEESPCFYLYEETMNGRSQMGLVCLSSVLEYENNIIKKHENTRADKELDRINHVNIVNAQTGPIFLAYKDVKELNDYFEMVRNSTPLYTFFSEDGIEHRAFKISEEKDMNFIISAFANVPSLYIADGHHRCASAAKVSIMRRKSEPVIDENAEYNYFLSVVFPESELMIMDYNRVIKDLNGLSEDEFVREVSKNFKIKEITLSDNKPLKKGDIFMIFKDREFLINLKDDLMSDDPVKALDVSILQDYILDPILDIKDPKTDKRIDFVGGIRGVKELRKRISSDCTVAFSMYPTQMNELFKVADSGNLMPPKSTWFEPKLRSGLFIHELS